MYTNDTGMVVTKGNRVRELRESKGWTQSQLADEARIALRTIHSVEKGINCRMDTVRKIILALELRIDDKHDIFPARKPEPRQTGAVQ